MRLKPNQVQTAGKMLTPEIVLEVNTSISESSGYILSFLTQGREPWLPSALFDRKTLGTGWATETTVENAGYRLRHVESSMRGGRKATQVAQTRHTVAFGDSIRNTLEELTYLLPVEVGEWAVQI